MSVEKREYPLPVGGIVLTAIDGNFLGVRSGLKKGIPESDDRLLCTAEAIELIVLAHASAGVDVSSAAYLKGLETTVQLYGLDDE